MDLGLDHHAGNKYVKDLDLDGSRDSDLGSGSRSEVKQLFKSKRCNGALKLVQLSSKAYHFTCILTVAVQGLEKKIQILQYTNTFPFF